MLSRYDPDWVIDGQMGPNALWLAEWLSTALDLQPGMRVLDLGCGKAMTSVFWAREFDLRVYAVATGEGGSQFRRFHRIPGTHPLGWARFFA